MNTETNTEYLRGLARDMQHEPEISERLREIADDYELLVNLWMEADLEEK